jgi:hypothetical protein
MITSGFANQSRSGVVAACASITNSLTRNLRLELRVEAIFVKKQACNISLLSVDVRMCVSH